jgi:hypothetical protein
MQWRGSVTLVGWDGGTSCAMIRGGDGDLVRIASR